MTSINGPVPIGAEEYVYREFEKESLSLLLKREWVLMLGPRQHGKTSALIRIRNSLIDSGFRCAFIDLQALPPRPTLSQLLDWFGKKLAASLGTKIESNHSVKIDTLDDCLNFFVTAEGGPVIILIDEASAIQDDDVRNSFFGQIRAIKSAAAAAPNGSLSTIIQFVFSGTFRPDSLVDEKNSPFNVCTRVDTEDLSIDQVVSLAAITLRRKPETVVDVANKIFEYVGGQPHLVQSLLNILIGQEIASEVNAIDEEVQRLIVEGNEHTASIFRAVVQDADLLKIASAAASHGKISNDPANASYKFITTIGLLRREAQDLVFRNKLYEKIAQSSVQLRPGVIGNNGLSQLYQLQASNFAFVTDPELREICFSSYNGAICAANAGSFRLALVGFGSALEAMLIDWLSQQNSTHIAAEIAKVAGDQTKRVNFKHPEVANNPSTWRLVNLVKVGRLIKTVTGTLEIPDAVREFRNLVHPTVIKSKYCVEADLRPEVIACSGLVEIVMREIQR